MLWENSGVVFRSSVSARHVTYSRVVRSHFGQSVSSRHFGMVKDISVASRFPWRPLKLPQRTNTTILEQGTNLRSSPKTAYLETFSRTTSFRPSFAALSELVDSQLIEIVPVRQKSGLNFCWNDFIDKLYSTTQRLKSKLDSVGGTFFVCHFDRFLSLRKSPGNTVIDVDISVSAKAAREVTVRTTDIFALTLFWQHIFTGFSFQWCFVVHFLS